MTDAERNQARARAITRLREWTLEYERAFNGREPSAGELAQLEDQFSERGLELWQSLNRDAKAVQRGTGEEE